LAEVTRRFHAGDIDAEQARAYCTLGRTLLEAIQLADGYKEALKKIERLMEMHEKGKCGQRR
jgi:hypothetical protein